MNTTPTDDYNPSQRNMAAPAPLLGRLRGMLSSQVYTLGCDLSHWNASVDFRELKAGGYEFVVLKATEGTNYTDPTFVPRWQAALEADLIVGAYHFFRSNVPGTSQADYHLNVIRALLETTQGCIIPPALDVETNDGVTVATRTQRIRDWFSQVQGAVKRAPLCYSSPSLWQTLTNNMTLDCVGWTAHWTSAAAPSWPVGWPVAGRKFWQWGTTKYSWVPPVSGVTGEVDVNRFFGSLDELRAFVGIQELSLEEKVERLWTAHPGL